jgi:hypothetical protein
MNISSKDLIASYASIDLVSEYEHFLLDAAKSTNAHRLWCNCSQNDYSFGERCQYHFPVKTNSFNEVVSRSFAWKEIERNAGHTTAEEELTCYLLPNCTTNVSLCLDWRQICDGRLDCTNDRDEDYCLEKELSPL